MPYLECPGCGRKALKVATQCPHCGMAFEYRFYEHPPLSIRSRRIPPGAVVIGAIVLFLVVSFWREQSQAQVVTRPSAPADTSRATLSRPEAPPGVAAAPASLPPPADTPNQAPTPTPTVAVATPQAVEETPIPAGDAEQPEADKRLVARTWVNVRSGRSPSAPVIRILKPGELVLVDLPRLGWYQVAADGQNAGYVDGRFLAEP